MTTDQILIANRPKWAVKLGGLWAEPRVPFATSETLKRTLVSFTCIALKVAVKLSAGFLTH
jgi:hypothetical protein